MSLPKTDIYTIEDIYALPEGQRAELIDEQIYNLAPPGTMHQRIIRRILTTIDNCIQNNKLPCEVFPAPFPVFLNADDRTYVEPDISVICDKSKLDEKGCHGAPDWIIEIVSPGSRSMDYLTKLLKYRSAGVREYWIINPAKETVQVYFFEDDEDSEPFFFSDDIPVRILEGFTVNISELLNRK